MKIRPLPGIDLARIAVQPLDAQRHALEAMKLWGPPYSYDPMRRAILDILHIAAGPLAAHSPTPWAVIEQSISRNGRSDAERKANLEAANALRRFADEEKVGGRRQEFFPLSLGLTSKVEYWSPAVAPVAGRATVLFIDPRKTKKLTAEARRFVHSVMHERIRVADPDYADVELGIIQFEDGGSGRRRARLFNAGSQSLFGFDALSQMVQQTYGLWREVLEERAATARRTGTGGPLFPI
jgi:hypothetical protein